MVKCPVCGAEVKEEDLVKCEMCFLRVCPNCITEREGQKVCKRCARFMDLVG
ncbi:MAG: hypothetical protein NDF54_11125 [archaeon GB-1867-035]|nr:hypothetical protein [Candidatus Culexmicrobium profundum]